MPEDLLFRLNAVRTEIITLANLTEIGGFDLKDFGIQWRLVGRLCAIQAGIDEAIAYVERNTAEGEVQND